MITAYNQATIADLRLWLTEREITDLTRERARNNCEPGELKADENLQLQQALDLADSIWCSKYIVCEPAGKVALLKIRKVTTLMLARYFLDEEKSRPSVVQQYAQAMEMLNQACQHGGEVSKEDAELIGEDSSTTKTYVYTEPSTLDRSMTTGYLRGGLYASSPSVLKNSERRRYYRRGRGDSTRGR